MYRIQCLVVVGLLVGTGVAPMPLHAAEWITLLDGTSLQGWNQTGNANWSVVDGVVQATTGPGFLVSPRTYADFELEAEVWVSDDANSGIFFRASDPTAITPATGYEVNLFDHRPDPKYRTGAIVDVAEPALTIDAGSRWSTIRIVASGPHLVVTLNGRTTVDVVHTQRSNGLIALQSTTGVVKFRRVRIRSL